MTYLRLFLATALLASMTWGAVHAGSHGCCEQCGHECQTKRVCHVIVETKKVPKTCYTCECEDFCVPGPSKRCGRAPEPADTPCGELCLQDRWFWNWIPGCGKIYKRSKLIKKVTQVEVQSFKWVVEDLCPECGAKAQTTKPDAKAVEATKTEPAPANPAPPADTTPAEVITTPTDKPSDPIINEE